MMNEKEILTQIKKECRSFSPDNFERIKESISDNYENAEVISASAGVRFDRNIFVRFAVAAAVLFFPLSFAVKYLTAGNGRNDYELMIPAVSVTEETSQVTGKTESVVTNVTVSEKQNVSGTGVTVSDLSGTDQAAVTEVSEAVRVTAENVTQKPKGTESQVKAAETQVRLTEAPARVTESPVPVTEPENQITDASAEATEEPKATEAVTEAAVQPEGAGTASHGGESFTS
ncbi:MAG: hypothetical protein J6W65_05840, partial [Oscillospiraceae bacterium]|nr:hypothetical protein [Oscillospiraceae bacterium]